MSYLRPCLNKTMKNKTKSQNKRGYLMFIMVNFTYQHGEWLSRSLAECFSGYACFWWRLVLRSVSPVKCTWVSCKVLRANIARQRKGWSELRFLIGAELLASFGRCCFSDLTISPLWSPIGESRGPQASPSSEPVFPIDCLAIDVLLVLEKRGWKLLIVYTARP